MSYVETNRAHWNELAADYARVARRHWATTEPTWGTFNISQVDVPMLPADVADLDVLELGCGTAYVSAWVARAGDRHGDWIRVLSASGFEVEDLIEIYAPADAQTDAEFITAEWAKKWPVEEAWFARLRDVHTEGPVGGAAHDK